MIKPTNAPPIPPNSARWKLAVSVRPDVAARNATYERHALTAAKTIEESLKKLGVIARTLMLRAAKAAKHTPDTAPIIVTSQRFPRTPLTFATSPSR